jgi:dTDP-4-dehydrorhamnose 3,5-epimerase-like enzyme
VIDLLIDANNLDLNNKFEIKLDFEETNQILLAPNIFHGFIVMSNNAILNYKSTEVYKANDERNLYIQDEFPQIYLQHQEYLILSDRDKKPKN